MRIIVIGIACLVLMVATVLLSLTVPIEDAEPGLIAWLGK